MECGGDADLSGFSLRQGRVILDRNMFVERVLPGSVLRKLGEAEMAEYRKPFLERESAGRR